MRAGYTLEPVRLPQLGLIVLQSDETIERDMRRLIPPDAELLVSRLPSSAHVTSETLSAMEAHLGAAAGLLPGGARLAVVGYGCTSGAAEIGPKRVAEAVSGAIVTGSVTEPLSALVAACSHLAISRLAVVSPYVPTVSARLSERLADAGITVDGIASFEEDEEARVVRIDRASVIKAALEVVAAREVDALFLSCTNLRTLDVIEPLESETGLPVMSSNLVLAWHMLRLARVAPARGVPGRLWASTSEPGESEAAEATQ